MWVGSSQVWLITERGIDYRIHACVATGENGGTVTAYIKGLKVYVQSEQFKVSWSKLMKV